MKTHIKLEKKSAHRNAIVCGSPERAAWFASKLEKAQPVAKNREYHSYLGTHKGKEILILSHGVGAAGAAICFQELIDAGAENIIRLGTAGGLYKGAGPGDIVIPTAAVRKDGVSALMMPPEYPAVPDMRLTSGLIGHFAANQVSAKSGIILTSDLFYPGKLPSDLEFFSGAGVIAVEMECSALFVICQLRSVRAGAALVLDGNPLGNAPDDYDPNPERLATSMEKCFVAAVETLAD